ncbi:uncharacterized protein BXZ73DRAFT_92530 [Epithele typhae]|uniref:uncharacterized protein n=1 Tax=Epithele typhae TaxID=378194 RepID=UPI0020078691|nr:uncharacterized protein BXZ73DRAFT_92530 [Epithele typhae]KAH9916299.1 hypothetical protein BXZ73DRAFT_92530 [Epithele typhae]
MFSVSKLVGVLALATLAVSTAASTGFNAPTKDLFDQSMTWLDKLYDPAAGYLYYFYLPLAAGPHETRSSGDDVEQACKIIRNVIADQEKDVEKQWFGDYTVFPEQPTVGTDAYPQSIYNTWDPNWRGFIGTNLIVIYEEFGSLLPVDVKQLILESIYRVGGVDGDNLYPSYSNPAIMRAVASGWTGRKLNESNMTAAGEMYAREIIDLFNVNDTLSEFNVPTYYGISLYGLTEGPGMIRAVWSAVGQFWHAGMRNLAGPWDRNYGYDTNRYVAILSLYVWSLAGREAALVPHAAVEALQMFSGERTVNRVAYAPPYDNAHRNVTTWLSEHLTIGAESFDQVALGGAREDQSAWAPAVVQWTREGGHVGFLVFHPAETAVQARVAPGELHLTYPNGTAESAFTFLVDTNPLGRKRDIAGVEDIYGLNVTIGFCGLVGGTCSIIHDFEFWNLTFVMPVNSTETPSISFKISHT